MSDLPGILKDGHENATKAKDFIRAVGKFEIEQETGCWVWIGAAQSNGYGRFWDGEKSNYAHRVMYELFNGPIQASMDLDHLCRNRRCVNPLHLEQVTRSENLKRGLTGENIAAPLRARTHCPQGHEYSEENTRRYAGRRVCRACCREKAKRYAMEKKHG